MTLTLMPAPIVAVIAGEALEGRRDLDQHVGPVDEPRWGSAANAAPKLARAVAPTRQAGSVIAPAPETPYAYCWEVAGQTQVAYFGAPFEAYARSVPVWSAAYKKVLQEKYNFAGVIHCGTLKSLGAAQERMQKEKDQMRVHWKVVETGWKYQ